jgi:predicted alpha/beta hydrolase family esterase
LTDETWDEDYTKEIAEEWINMPIDFEKIKKCTNKFVVINSDDDPYVPLSDTELFENNLGAEIIVLKNKGHIAGEDGSTDLPVVLEELLKMTKS